MKPKLKIETSALLLSALALFSCGVHNVKYQKPVFREIRFEMPREFAGEKLPLNELKVNYIKKNDSERELVIEVYGFSRGMETMSLSETGEFKRTLGPWELRAVMLFLKKSKIENTIFLTVKGRDQSELLNNLREGVNRALKP